MRDAGYERKAMCDALAIDKTVVSRMLQIVDRLGPDLITAIGAAPAVGRDRWGALAGKLETGDVDAETMRDMIAVQSHADSDSNDRFEIALRTGDPDAPARTLSKHTDADVPDKPRASRRTIMAPVSGVAIARVLLGSDKVVLTLPRDSGGGFEDWLVDHLSDIHRTWVNSRSDETPEK
jgi:ParB family chromosome partitioning protein